MLAPLGHLSTAARPEPGSGLAHSQLFMNVQYNVIATFDSSTKAEATLDRLFSQGFGIADVAVLMANRAGDRHFTIDAKHKFPEGAALGGVLGGSIGALLVGFAVTSGMTVSGLEAIDGGAIIAAFAGAGAGGLLGWLIGGLAGLGFDQHQARLVEGHAKDSHIVLGVRADDPGRAQLAEGILTQGGATSVAS
jgi:hypothetical protein